MGPPNPNQSALPFESFATAEERNAVPPFNVSLLALSRVRGLGRKSLITLVKVFGEDLGKVWETPREKIRDILVGAKAPAAEDVASEIAAHKGSLIVWSKSKVHELAKRRIYVIGPSSYLWLFRKYPTRPLGYSYRAMCTCFTSTLSWP